MPSSREYGVADLRGKCAMEKAAELVKVAHPDYRPLLLDYMKYAAQNGGHTPPLPVGCIRHARHLSAQGRHATDRLGRICKITPGIYEKTSLLLYLAFSFCGSISFAQQALTPEVLQTLKESYSHDDAHKAIRNAVNANSIKKLTANSEQAATPDTWFSHKVKSSGISDQKSSGRCWLFTGTNVIRAQVMARTE